MKCQCAREYQIDILGPGDYARFKRVLDRGHHPTMIGRSMFGRNAQNGGATAYLHQDADAAVSLINPRVSSFLVLNVVPQHHGHGLGISIIRHQATNWARVLDAVVPYFERCGYEKIGPPKPGRRFATQVMVRKDLHKLAGRIHKYRHGPCTCSLNEVHSDASSRRHDIRTDAPRPGNNLHTHDATPQDPTTRQEHAFPPPHIPPQQQRTPPRRQRSELRRLPPRHDFVKVRPPDHEQHGASMAPQPLEPNPHPLNTHRGRS